MWEKQTVYFFRWRMFEYKWKSNTAWRPYDEIFWTETLQHSKQESKQKEKIEWLVSGNRCTIVNRCWCRRYEHINWSVDDPQRRTSFLNKPIRVGYNIAKYPCDGNIKFEKRDYIEYFWLRLCLMILWMRMLEIEAFMKPYFEIKSIWNLIEYLINRLLLMWKRWSGKRKSIF